MNLKSIKKVDVSGKRVLLRASCNVPIEGGQIDNDFRLQKSLATINWLKEEGAKVVIISHIWGDETTSLEVVYEWYKKHLDLKFITDYQDAQAQEKVESLKAGEVVLFENLRLHEGERGNSSEFASMLAEYGDIYVNDAFPVSHREHASITSLSGLLPAYAGVQLEKEVTEISRVFDPVRPFLAILSGAKFSTKIPLIERFLDQADYVYVGGALAHPFLQAQGREIGRSLMPDEPLQTDLSQLAHEKNLVLPIDAITDHGEVKQISDIYSHEAIKDIGPASIEELKSLVDDARLVIWNGPLGDYEKDFEYSTHCLSRYLAQDEAFSIVGGGDTLAVILEDHQEGDFGFVSTAGGAMIEFMTHGTLPGLQSLKA